MADPILRVKIVVTDGTRFELDIDEFGAAR